MNVRELVASVIDDEHGALGAAARARHNNLRIRGLSTIGAHSRHEITIPSELGSACATTPRAPQVQRVAIARSAGFPKGTSARETSVTVARVGDILLTVGGVRHRVAVAVVEAGVAIEGLLGGARSLAALAAAQTVPAQQRRVVAVGVGGHVQRGLQQVHELCGAEQQQQQPQEGGAPAPRAEAAEEVRAQPRGGRQHESAQHGARDHAQLLLLLVLVRGHRDTVWGVDGGGARVSE